MRSRLVPAVLSATFLASSAWAQDGDKPRPADPQPNSEIARYCGALEPSLQEARAASQLRKLAELEVRVRAAVEKLEAREQAAQEWVDKREKMMKSATEDVVAIFAKMAPDAAAAQLAAVDEPVAVAVLAKLKPQAASAILGEMQADKAAKLSTLIAGAASDKS